MQENKRLMLVVAIVAAFMTVGLFLPGLITAGDLEPSGAPGPTMRTLDEIYNVIVDGCPDPGCPACDNAPVAQTGQTTCYDESGADLLCSGTGQDGDLQAGVAWPNPRFKDNNDGTVTDNLTGLIWLQNANCPISTRNWETALSDVAQLNTDGTMNDNDCGDTSNAGNHQTDWRLPNIKELISLMDFGNHQPVLPTGYNLFFSGVQWSTYWSSTTASYNTDYIWTVTLQDGQVAYKGKGINIFLWPVRGGN